MTTIAAPAASAAATPTAESSNTRLSVAGGGAEKRDGAGNAPNAIDVGDLEAGHGSRLPIGNEIGSVKPAASLGGLNAVDRGQE